MPAIPQTYYLDDFMNELEPHRLSFPLLGSRHLMRDLEDNEVQLNCRLSRFGGQVVADERREFVSGNFSGLFLTA